MLQGKAITLNSGQVTFNNTKTTERIVLNFASLKDNSNKFYIMELQEGNGDYNFCVYSEYGRLGKNPRRIGRYFNSYTAALHEFNRLKRDKNRTGYKKVEVDDGFHLSNQTTKIIKTKESKEALNSINDKVLRFIGKVYQQTTKFLVSSIDTPLGKLSTNQVAKGFEILSYIEAELDDKCLPQMLEYLSDDFYSVIPIPFGSRVNYKKFIIDDYEKLNDKKDLLGVMKSVVDVQKSLEDTLEEKYKALNIKLKVLSKRTNKYKEIVEMVNNSKGYNHHFNLDIKEIYEIEDMTGHKDFNPYKCTTMELFHGSRNENILGILQNGLRIKPASAVHTGSMFGSAIYFADSSTKSANYCWGFGNRHSGDSENFMFLGDVATGKIKEFDTAQPYLRSAPQGFNSVLGKKGRHLIHDEYMVYKENQVKLRYIIEFKKR